MTRKILIVEDQPEIRKLIAFTLDYGGFSLHEACDAAQGLSRAEALAPDLVLLDIRLPGEFDGLEVCRRIRADPRLDRTRVVLLTACAEDIDLAAGRYARCDAYVTKPFSPLALIATVEEVLQSRGPRPRGLSSR